MTDTCSIAFTATVTRVNAFEDNALIGISSDFGGKYPHKATLNVKDARGVEKGDAIRVTASEPPKGKAKEFTNQEGDLVKFAELTYWNPKVELVNAKQSFTHPDDDDSEIPF